LSTAQFVPNLAIQYCLVNLIYFVS